MDLSVVIPTLNEAAHIEACIASALALREGWLVGWEASGSDKASLEDAAGLEVVVADGGSSDATVQIAEAAGARVVRSSPGRGRQLQAGVLHATGDVVLLLHADTRLAPEAAEQLAAALRDPKTGCGAFHQRVDAPGGVYRLLERGNAFRARRFGLPYGDQAIFVRRELLDAVGGVPGQPLMEDVELMRRLRRRAWPVVLPGPLHISARRWRQHGVVRQTLRNWSLLAAYGAGVSPSRLAGWYKPHQPDR